MHVKTEDVHQLGEWWKHKAVLPTTIEHKNNFVLFPAELAEYRDALTALIECAEKERARVNTQVRAMERGFVAWFQEPPKWPYTLCDMLQFKVNKGKVELRIMQWVLAVTQRHINLLGDSNAVRS